MAKRMFPRRRKIPAHRKQNKEHVHDDVEEHEQDQFSDEFSSFIKKKTDDLTNIVSTQFGLLEVLADNNVLTSKQVSLIPDKDSNLGQVRQLLEEITRETISDEVKKTFLRALDETQQKHVSNFIRGKGEHAAEYGDNWPLFRYPQQQRMLTNRRKLIDLIDTRGGLLDEMLSVECINTRQVHHIEAGTTDEEQGERLYEIVLWGSLATYHAFITCLRQTKQHQVVYLLEPTLAGDGRPLSEEQQSRLQMNYATLVSCISLNEGLTAELYATDCITWRQKDYFEQAAPTNFDKIKRLLDIIRRGSEKGFHKFVECLNKTGQRHASDLLLGDGARTTSLTDTRRPDKAASSSTPQSEIVHVNKSDMKRQDCMGAVDVMRPRDPQSIASELERRRIMEPETHDGDSLNIKQYITEPEHGLYTKRMKDNYPSLLNLIDSRHGLLDEMCYVVDCITELTKEEIEAEVVNAKRNQHLLKVLMRAGINLHIQNKFIYSLLKTGQFAVVCLLAPDIGEVAGMQPVSEKDRNRLNRCKQLINIDADLLDVLVDNNCITGRQKESIAALLTSPERKSLLVDMIKQGTTQNMVTFLRLVPENDTRTKRKALNYTPQLQITNGTDPTNSDESPEWDMTFPPPSATDGANVLNTSSSGADSGDQLLSSVTTARTSTHLQSFMQPQMSVQQQTAHRPTHLWERPIISLGVDFFCFLGLLCYGHNF